MCLCSSVGRVRAAPGTFHIAVRRPVPVHARPGVSGSHRDLRAMARSRLWPFRLRAVEGYRTDRNRRAGSCARHIH